MGGIEGGGGFHHLNFEPDAEVIGEIAQENAELIHKHTGASSKDSVQKSNEGSNRLPAYLTTDPDNPALPPGLSDVKIKEKLDGATAGHKEIAARMMGELPGNPGSLGEGTFSGLQDGIADISKVSAASGNFLSGVEGMHPIPTSEQLANLQLGGPGPVDPSSSPLQQNVQVAVNGGAILENTSRVIGGEVQEMPEGPKKDSLMAFLANIDQAIADLKGVLDKIQQGEGISGKEGMGKAAVTDLADWNAQAAKKQDEADKAKDDGKGGPFGDLFSMTGLDVLGEITDMIGLGNITEELGLDSIGDMFGGLFDGDLLGGITDMLGEIPLVGEFLSDPAVLMAIVGGVIGTALLPFAMPFSMLIGAALGLMIGGMLGGEDSAFGSMMEGIPIVGDLLGEDGLGGMLSGVIGGIPIIGDLFGGGGGSSSGNAASKEDIQDRIAARRASQGAANGAVAGAAGKRAGEIDEAAEENAELAADIQKLIQLLTAMKNGGSPAALSGELEAVLSKIGNADIPGLEGHDAFFSQMQQASEYANSGDYEAMINSIDQGFEAEGINTADGLGGAQDAIAGVFSPVAEIETDDFSGFNFLSGAA